jgi:glutaredoxin-like protein NrdH
MRVTVYTQSFCQPCRATKRKLGQLGIPYYEVPVDRNPDALDLIKSWGFTSAPVVRVDLGDGATWTWYGYAPTQIARLANEIIAKEELAA